MKDRIKLMKMQKLQRSVRVSNRDRKLVTFLTTLNSEASKLSLPDHVKETASIYQSYRYHSETGEQSPKT